MDDTLTKRFLEQAFELWITPEVEKRQAARTIPSPFSLRAAQVIMTVNGDPPEVRLNSEVVAVMRAEAKGPIAIGQPVRWDDLGDIRDVELTDADPDAAHVTLLRHPRGWLISFDFRYNSATSKETLAAAKQFLAAAAHSLEEGRMRPFADELHSAAELMAKALLMLIPDRSYLTSKKHNFFASRFNHWGKLGNVPRPFVKLLNDVRAVRGPARYLDGPFELPSHRAAEMLQVGREMMIYAEAQVPGRVPVLPGRWAQSHRGKSSKK